ncbi:MAG TPA: hypothetical protein VFF73_05010 [Planctomycetota bacterium]|nr:hypothetical protein [Planctomycetota bacterium]
MASVKEKEKDEERSSGTGTGLLVAFGFAVLVGVYALSKMLNGEPGPPELPLASILVQTNNGFDAASRTQLVQMVNAINATEAFGNPVTPTGTTYLLPGAKPGDDPIVKGFADMTDEEWAKAWGYMAKTEYYVPRLFRLDGNACVIRLDPRDFKKGFESDAGSRLQKAIEPFRDKFKAIRVYSHAMGVGSAEDKDALNASFGCNLLFMFVGGSAMGGAPETQPRWRSPAGMKQLGSARDTLKNPHFRSITTGASFVKYFWTVCLQAEKEVDLPAKDEEITRALDFARGKMLVTFVTNDGKQATVDTTTDTEGWDQVDLFWEFETSLQTDWKVEVKNPWQPTRIHRTLKAGPTPIK